MANVVHRDEHEIVAGREIRWNGTENGGWGEGANETRDVAHSNTGVSQKKMVPADVHSDRIIAGRTEDRCDVGCHSTTVVEKEGRREYTTQGRDGDCSLIGTVVLGWNETLNFSVASSKDKTRIGIDVHLEI